MRRWDDGKVGVSLERVVSVLRIHPGVPDGTHPPFTGSGLLLDVSEGVAKLAGLSADQITRAHLRLIARALLEEGISTLIADRATGHRLPLATQIETGPFAGWWTVDLLSVRLAGRRRPRPA